MRKKVLVLGSNFGGLTAALAVKHELHGDVDVTVVSPSAGFRSMLAMAPTRPAASSASPNVGGAARVRAPFDAFSRACFTWASVRSATRPRPVVVRSMVSSCISTNWPSRVRTASNSRIALGIARPVASIAARSRLFEVYRKSRRRAASVA